MREKHRLSFQCKVGLLLWSKHVFCVDHYTYIAGEGINGYREGGGGVNVNSYMGEPGCVLFVELPINRR